MFYSNPLTGVGWFQYRVLFWTGQYSHSDYIETLASTGLVGFILYQSWYCILVIRIIWLIWIQKDVEIRYQLKTMLLVVLSILFLGFGTPHYGSILVFLMLVSISVYTWRLKCDFAHKEGGSDLNTVLCIK